MKLVIGLGNPGDKYAHTRHNIGFMALDAIAAQHAKTPWRSKFQSLVCTMALGTDTYILLKPQTYMNDSGRAVAAAMRFYKLNPCDIIVLHDELDLPVGKMRVKIGGGHAGHNGLRSIDTHCGAHYQRVRIGIGHPGHKDQVNAYVLHGFSKAEQNRLDAMLASVAHHLATLLGGQGERFQSDIAQDKER